PFSSIERIADKRVADARHVDANLMGAAGLQPAPDMTRPGAEGSADTVRRFRRFPAASNDGHFFSVARAAANSAGDGAFGRAYKPPSECIVCALDVVCGKLCR